MWRNSVPGERHLIICTVRCHYSTLDGSGNMLTASHHPIFRHTYPSWPITEPLSSLPKTPPSTGPSICSSKPENTLPKPSLTSFHYLYQRLHKFPRIFTSRRPPRAVTRHVVRFAQPVVHLYFMQGGLLLSRRTEPPAA